LDAAESLNLSRRQVFRIKAKVVASGPEGILHGNRGRQPATAKPERLKKKIRDLYQKVYRGFNTTHFTEKLNEIEGIDISRETVRKDLRQHNLIGEMRHAPTCLSEDARRQEHRSRRERMPTCLCGHADRWWV